MNNKCKINELLATELSFREQKPEIILKSITSNRNNSI